MKTKVKDPVCGAELDDSAKRVRFHNQDRYYFCSRACEQKFEANPETFVHPKT
jgi:Cu+-exporting ATPase